MKKVYEAAKDKAVAGQPPTGLICNITVTQRPKIYNNEVGPAPASSTTQLTGRPPPCTSWPAHRQHRPGQRRRSRTAAR